MEIHYIVNLYDTPKGLNSGGSSVIHSSLFGLSGSRDWFYKKWRVDSLVIITYSSGILTVEHTLISKVSSCHNC